MALKLDHSIETCLKPLFLFSYWRLSQGFGLEHHDNYPRQDSLDSQFYSPQPRRTEFFPNHKISLSHD